MRKTNSINTRRRKISTSGCFYCINKKTPRYADGEISRFVNDRARINGRERSGICSKHQRALSREIKRARHLSLIPFKISV